MTTTSSTSSATSSLVSALGAGSGVDMGALAASLATAQFAAKTDRLNTLSDKLDQQISTASTLKSALLALSSSLGDRVRVGDLSPTPQVANSAVASGVLSGTSRPNGSYTLEVTKLAAAQTLTSGTFAASTSTVGSGTLTIKFGTVADGTYTADPDHASVDIAIPQGATLADVAVAINQSGSGVTAYVANTVDGAKLVLKGAEGAANGFVLEAAEDSGDPGLSALAWEPTTGAASQLMVTSSDAFFKIDGLSMTSKTNKVTEAVPGVTLTLTGTNAGSPTTLGFADPSAGITTTMEDIVSVLNEIVSQLNTATAPQTGELVRDPGARALKTTLAGLGTVVIMPNAPAGTPRTLSDLGLTIQRDGTFTLDSARLSATLAKNPQAAGDMFTNGLYGVFATVEGIVRKATTSTDPGSLGGSIVRYTAQKTTNTEDLSAIADKQEALRAQLTTRFAAADTRISNSQSTLTFLKNQIAAWNKSSD
ncbi:MAG: flagellar filament capping protein FliD [Novosphingobium sp.]